MVNYRRNRIPGACYFFTVTLRDRKSDLLTRYVDILRASFRKTMIKTPFRIEAIVVLPDHLHTIWTLPDGDDNYQGRWRSIKSTFTFRLRKHLQLDIPSPWQTRYWEHTLRDERDYQNHMDYIHFNPVKHGHSKRVRDWPHSSFHQYVRQGLYPPQWGDEYIESNFSIGE